MRIAYVEGDVAPRRPLVSQRTRKLFIGFEGLCEEKPPPTKLQRDMLVLLSRGLIGRRAGRLHGFTAQTFQAVAERLVATPARGTQSRILFLGHRLYPVGLQPEFEQPYLPEFGTAQGCNVISRRGVERIQIILTEEATLTRRLRG